MGRFNCLVGFAMVLFAAGCAGLDVATQSVGGATTAQADTAHPSSVAGNQAVAQVLESEPTVFELREFAPNENFGSICREMLKPLSNVIVKRCMTPAEWKEFERREALWAQQILRTFQGSAYR
jgi:hypothetical protein